MHIFVQLVEKKFLAFRRLYRAISLPIFPADRKNNCYHRCIFSQIFNTYLDKMLSCSRSSSLYSTGLWALFWQTCETPISCCGVKRAEGDNTRVRLPITTLHLLLFHALLAVPYTTNLAWVMVWAAMTLAFFGFLRLGELTFYSQVSPLMMRGSSPKRITPTLWHIKSFQTRTFSHWPYRHFRKIWCSSLPHFGHEKKYLLGKTTSSRSLFTYSSGKSLKWL